MLHVDYTTSVKECIRKEYVMHTLATVVKLSLFLIYVHHAHGCNTVCSSTTSSVSTSLYIDHAVYAVV